MHIPLICVFVVLSIGLIYLITFLMQMYSVIAKIPRYEQYMEKLLDKKECDRQMEAIKNNLLLFFLFADAGLRIPSSILKGSFVNLGNYHQCLSIDQVINSSRIQGKYCSITVSSAQSFDTPLSQDFQRVSPFNPKHLQVYGELIAEKIKHNKKLNILISMMIGNYADSGNESAVPIQFKLAICVPRPCSSEQFLSLMVYNGVLGWNYTEDNCRFPGDIPWTTTDLTAVIVFSLLGVVTLLSTCYDISYRFILKKDIAEVQKLCQSFSVYTNGQRLTTFSSGPGTLQCLDGIRAISMLCVVIGHSYSTEIYRSNVFDYFDWLSTPDSLWTAITSLSVDTFLTLAGLLVMYKTAQKKNSSEFLKNIHWFYIHRVMKINPLLAVTVLLQASLFSRMTDGPHWYNLSQIKICNDYWWTTLLHIENFVNPSTICVIHAWYLAIDMHLYFLSPLVLYWVLSNERRQAWISLTAALVIVMVASTAYIFYINVPAGSLAEVEISKSKFNYKLHYYINTIARAPPFFVGMMFGYLLHIYRNKKVYLTLVQVTLLWMCVMGVSGSTIYFEFAVKQPDYDHPTIDSVMNAIMRPVWGAALGLVIFACIHGYGGPVNWFLCLDFWRIPSRLSYAIFLFHYPLMFIMNSTEFEPVNFSQARCFFKFITCWILSMVVAFVFTLLIDLPISYLLQPNNELSTGKAKKPKTQNP